MVIFDILASHHRMLLWHESSVENLLKETADLQRASQQAEGQAAESSSHANENGLQDASELRQNSGNEADGAALSGQETIAAPAADLHRANLPLDRR